MKTLRGDEGTIEASAAKAPAAPHQQHVEVVDWPMVLILRQKTEAQRLAISWGMWKSARDMLRNLVRSEHPDWSEGEVRSYVAKRLAHGTR
jgi:hypothetical protein